MRAQAGVEAVFWIESRKSEGLGALCSKKRQMIIALFHSFDVTPCDTDVP